jgi:hypothetical protein
MIDILAVLGFIGILAVGVLIIIDFFRLFR